MLRQWIYGIALFLGSAGGMVVEIAAGRMLAPYVGMSLYTWTAIIAVVLAGLSVGHWIGGRLAGPNMTRTAGEWWVAVSFAGAALTALASLVLMRLLAGWLMPVGLGTVPLIVAMATGAFLLPSLAVGVVSPVLTKLAVDLAPSQTGAIIGRMYALAASGSILGTLASGYLFISWVGSFGTIWVVSGLYAVLALVLGILARRWVPLVPGIATGVIIVLMVGQGTRAFHSPCLVESDYYCIRVEDFSTQTGRESTLMVLDHLAHSMNDRERPDLLYSPYVHGVAELLKMRSGGGRPASAFFVGGGGYSLPRAWAAQGPGGHYVVAEIDPAVTRIAADHMWLDTEAPGLEILHQDARMALAAQPLNTRYDVIFGDAFHDISIPAHLASREFAELVHDRLSREGLYLVNVVDRGNDPRFLFSFVRTLATVFPVVEVWVEREEIGNPGRVTFVVAAGSEASPTGLLRSTGGIDREWRRWPWENLKKRLDLSAVPILTDDFAPVDRLLAPLLTADPT